MLTKFYLLYSEMKPLTPTCYSGLCKLARLNPAGRRQALKNCPDVYINSISELCLNCLKGSLPIERRKLNLLKCHRKQLHALSDKRNSLSIRRKLCVQKGGFLPLLLRFALPIIGSYIASKTK